MTKKVIAIALVILTIVSTLTITVSAASYSKGSYTVTAKSGVNVRKGAGTNYSKVGAATKGTTFSVTKVSGSWGYTSSIKTTSGKKAGWISLSNCKYNAPAISTYNDVFASTRGSGYSVSQALATQSTSFYKNNTIYIWGYLHDINNNGYLTYSSANFNLTLSIYRPDGSCAFTYTYKNTDNNWIRCKLDRAGTWKIQSKVTGAISGTNTRTITVKEKNSTVYPTGVSLSSTSYTTTVGDGKVIAATVYPSNASNKSVTWSSSNSQIVSVSQYGAVLGKGLGKATVTARTSNGKTATCTVSVTGIAITGVPAGNRMVKNDVVYLGTKLYPNNTSKFTWSSSNSKVVKVDSNGKITAKAAGNATISVSTADGRRDYIFITVTEGQKWITGCFEDTYPAKGYTTVSLNKNAGDGYIKIYSYNKLGAKDTAWIHVTLRDKYGNYICEFDTKTGQKLRLGNDHDSYRVYISKKKYGDNIWESGKGFINTGSCVYWGIECVDKSYIK